uniref:Homeobox domain-containing protein n=1 Tax=Panagrolaimus sp. PS1159 TaxID=55785 RepID=A0AC35F8E7_9BILA
MNLENILSKNFPKLPPPQPPMLPSMDQQMLQYLSFIMQQSNKHLIPSMPPPSSATTTTTLSANSVNPLLQCNMFFPFLPPSPYQQQNTQLSASAPPNPMLPMPSTPRTPSSTYSIQNILSSVPQQKPLSQVFPSPSLKSQIPDAAYLLNNLFSPSSPANTFHPQRQQPILRAHVTRESSKPLREWMFTHLHDPYPTPNEIEELANITGFSRKQVRDWFTNNRRRYEQSLIKKNKQLPWKKREASKIVRDPY